MHLCYLRQILDEKGALLRYNGIPAKVYCDNSNQIFMNSVLFFTAYILSISFYF